MAARRPHEPKVVGSSPTFDTTSGFRSSADRLLWEQDVVGSIPTKNSDQDAPTLSEVGH